MKSEQAQGVENKIAFCFGAGGTICCQEKIFCKQDPKKENRNLI